MPYFEPSSPVEFDTVGIVNLKRVLELCTVPDVGPSPLDPHLTAESRCANALTTLEKTAGVFDDALYQDGVFGGQVDEDWLDRQLLLRAKSKFVPDAHFPALCMKHVPTCPPPVLAVVLTPIPESSISETLRRPKSNSHAQSADLSRGRASHRMSVAESTRSLSVKSTRYSIEPMAKSSLRQSLSLSTSWRKRSRDERLSSDTARPPSPSSVFSSFSRSPSASALTKRSKTRDSFRSLFRREYKPVNMPAPLDETREWSASPMDGDDPSIASACNSSLLSSPSTSLSSRTSTSSFADISTYSWTDSRMLQKCTKNPRFIALRLRCVTEAKRFVDFAQHQRVALPLFLGRSRMYMEARKESRVASLKIKHDLELEALENRHLEQELAEMDEHDEEAKEESTKNATALKHMQARLLLLGDSATLEDRLRLEDEMQAMEKLAWRQRKDMRDLRRIQYRENLTLQKAHVKELEELNACIEQEDNAKIRVKEQELQSNLERLEELIHVRSIRLTARWHLTLQIFKQEDRHAFSIKAPLPLSILGLPEEFGPYVAAYH